MKPEADTSEVQRFDETYGPALAKTEQSRLVAEHLREANERLVLATLKAQALAEAAEQSAEKTATTAHLEIKELEASKQVTLGVLAGGVAHDFNNLLTTIIGNADLGIVTLEPDNPVQGNLKAINKAASRATELTQQLLAYAGKGRCVVSEVDLVLVTREILQLLAVTIPKAIQIHSELEERLPYVKADPTQVFQILMNLITNAIESVAPGQAGRITITAHSEHVLEKAALSSSWVLPLVSGDYATIEVADSGVGMTTEVQARIFEPFYSTKFTGRGLGLAAVLGILRSHHGALRVQSRPGRGTSFKFYLPAMREARGPLHPEAQPPLHDKGTLLIADGREDMRSAARRLGENLGFSILEARNGLEAIESFRQHRSELVLVFLAAVMPGLGVQETYRRIRELDPQIPIVLTNGFRSPGEGLVLDGMAGLLKNPYRKSEFQGLLGRTLGLQPPSSGNLSAGQSN